ncbi:MAG: response regulator transcription factor [Acidimicrobiia bacterium]
MMADYQAAAIRVVLVGDHPMLVEPLQRWIGDDRRFAASSVTGTTDKIVSHCLQTRPDVAVIDHQSANGGSAVARRLRMALPGVKLLLLVPRTEPATTRIAADAGCVGVVSKEQPPDALVAAVLAATGESAMTRPLHAAAANGYAPTRLTSREHEVLRLLADGLSTSELCAHLYVSRNTARAHVQRVITKLGAHSKLEAVAIARRAGLV